MAGVVSTYGYPNGADEYTKKAKIQDPKRPADWSAEEKLKVVMEAVLLDQEQLGTFYAKKVCIRSILSSGTLEMIEGLQNGFSKKQAIEKKADANRIRSLEKELHLTGVLRRRTLADHRSD